MFVYCSKNITQTITIQINSVVSNKPMPFGDLLRGKVGAFEPTILEDSSSNL